MVDREKVVNELEWILNDIEENGRCHVNYYAGEIRNVLALLKEQELVEPRKILPCITRPVGGYVCGYCGIRFLEKNDYYCPNCGRKVKWDG